MVALQMSNDWLDCGSTFQHVTNRLCNAFRKLFYNVNLCWPRIIMPLVTLVYDNILWRLPCDPLHLSDRRLQSVPIERIAVQCLNSNYPVRLVRRHNAHLAAKFISLVSFKSCSYWFSPAPSSVLPIARVPVTYRL